LDYKALAPVGYAAMGQLKKYVESGDLPPALVEMIYLRVSLINGCSFCVDMHSRALRGLGEDERRVACVGAWREAPFYSAAERAALAWAEAVTEIADGHAPDDLYDEMCRHFSETEIVAATYAAILMNGFNRIAIGFRLIPPERV
jgi:AhpD family alkylhydroperoxidase